MSLKEELITEPATASEEEEEQEERDPEFPEVERPDDPEMRAALKRGEKKQKSKPVKTAKEVASEVDDATDDGTITEFLMDEMPELKGDPQPIWQGFYPIRGRLEPIAASSCTEQLRCWRSGS